MTLYKAFHGPSHCLKKDISTPSDFKPYVVCMHQKNRNRVYKFQSSTEGKKWREEKGKKNFQSI